MLPEILGAMGLDGDRFDRAHDVDGQPWFVAVDVCRAIDHGTTAKAIAPLASDEKGVSLFHTHGGNQKLTIISESGLYKLAMRSSKPNAKVFADWVTRDVLPAIRKDGGYIMGEEKVATGEMSEDDLLARALIVAKNKMDRLAAERDALQAKFAAVESENVHPAWGGWGI